MIRIALISLAFSLAACENRATGNDSAGMAGNADNASALARDDATMANEAMASSRAMSPQEFVDTASASDAYEIASSQLALEKGQTQPVKQFAQRMIEEHRKSTADLKQAATSASTPVTPSGQMTPAQQADLQQLRNADGQAFDTAYINQQRSAHERTLAALQGYASAGGEPSLQAFANNTAPVVQQHLTMLQQMGNPTQR